ncbi:MAG: sel1 repeat family protein [Deltaproteobacteria bacterium]|nr:sel1 repeat family protein [Deltaproteobacteria bacterium]
MKTILYIKKKLAPGLMLVFFCISMVFAADVASTSAKKNSETLPAVVQTSCFEATYNNEYLKEHPWQKFDRIYMQLTAATLENHYSFQIRRADFGNHAALVQGTCEKAGNNLSCHYDKEIINESHPKKINGIENISDKKNHGIMQLKPLVRGIEIAVSVSDDFWVNTSTKLLGDSSTAKLLTLELTQIADRDCQRLVAAFAKPATQFDEAACSLQDPRLCYAIFVFKYNGSLGGSQDIRPTARRYAETACNGGSGSACFKLASEFYYSDHERYDYFIKACDLGNLVSCSMLSNRYVRPVWGIGFKEPSTDEQKQAWGKKACDGGSMKGCFKYWQWLEEEESDPLFKKACDDGWSEACGSVVERLITKRRYSEAAKIWEHHCGIYNPNETQECFFATHPEEVLTFSCARGNNPDACADLSLWFKARGQKKNAARYRKQACTELNLRPCTFESFEPLPEFTKLH